MLLPLFIGAGIGSLVTLSLVQDKFAKRTIPENEEGAAFIMKVLSSPPSFMAPERMTARWQNAALVERDYHEALRRFETSGYVLSDEQRGMVHFLMVGQV